MKISFGQTARELGLLYPHVSALAKAGKITYETVGNFKFIDRADLSKVRDAAVEANYIKVNPSPDPKHFPAWLNAMGWEDATTLSEKARGNLFIAFKRGFEPPEPEPERPLPGKVDYDSRINLPLEVQIEAAREANPEA